jgi:hypothetical protein
VFDAGVAREWAEANQISFVDIEDLIRLYRASLPDWDGLQATLSDGHLKARLFGLGNPNAINQLLLGIRTKSLADLRDGFAGLGIEWATDDKALIFAALSAHRFDPNDFNL